MFKVAGEFMREQSEVFEQKISYDKKINVTEKAFGNL